MITLVSEAGTGGAGSLSPQSIENMISLLIILAGGGSIIGVFLRLTFGKKEQASAAFIDGHTVASSACEKQMEALRAEITASFTAQIRILEAQYLRELNDVRAELHRYRDGVVQLVPLVRHDAMSEALRVLGDVMVEPPSHDLPG